MLSHLSTLSRNWLEISIKISAAKNNNKNEELGWGKRKKIQTGGIPVNLKTFASVTFVS